MHTAEELIPIEPSLALLARQKSLRVFFRSEHQLTYSIYLIFKFSRLGHRYDPFLHVRQLLISPGLSNYGQAALTNNPNRSQVLV